METNHTKKQQRKSTTINFYLKHPTSVSDSIILLVMNCPAFIAKVSTGERIAVKDWNKNTQRPRKSYRHFESLNTFLNQTSDKAKESELRAKNESRPFTPERLRFDLEHAAGTNSKNSATGFFAEFDQYLNVKEGKLSPAFLAKMRTLKKHLHEFQKSKSYPITFERVNLEFHELFTSYLLKDKNQLDSTLNKYVALLKNFMNWTLKLKKHKSVDFKDSDFSSSSIESELIALTLDEVLALYNFDLKNCERLQKIREAFCFQCFTGLRYSEVSGITEANVRGDELYFREHKTKALRVKVLNHYALEILRRNRYSIPVISNQKSNQYLKELCKLVGIDTLVQVTKYRGSERIEIVKPKYEFISTHIGRATYITISLQLNVPAEVLRRDTGHSSHASFNRYIRFSEAYSSDVLRNAWGGVAKVIELKTVNLS